MPTPIHDCKVISERPTSADNYAEREAQVDEIVARLRRNEIEANKPRRHERA